MTVYNINIGIGWASSGVEYAQAYRSTIFRNLHIPAKFIFTDMFQQDNLSDLTRNLGFSDGEIIWLYTFFTDQRVAPVTFTLADLEQTIPYEITSREKLGANLRLHCAGEDIFYTVYFVKGSQELVHRVELVSRKNLIRKDYYSYTKVFSEYYTPRDGRAYLYQRRFFNEDGTTAYEESIEGSQSIFRFPDRICFSKKELIAYMMERLHLTSKDIVIMDRASEAGQAAFTHVKPAKLGVVVHAEHYSKNQVNDHTILWNNYYEYEFTHADKVDFFVTATEKQREVMLEQFEKYSSYQPHIVAIPVGSVDQLRYPPTERKPYAVMTASRLATEKHVDWLVKAVIALHEDLPQVTFDIYGKGGEEGKIRSIIEQHNAQSYIRLMGHHDLTNVYQNYELYLSASKSEGFGLTLLEAVGAGLAMIGFDVPYGNQTFINDTQNGYLIPAFEVDDETQIVQAFIDQVKKYFAKQDRKSFHDQSYQIAKAYLTQEIEKKWKVLVEDMTRD